MNSTLGVIISTTIRLSSQYLFIIYLIIKIVIIDWSKLNHVTRRKSTYHCLEGLGVLSFDPRSNDSTPKPCDRSSNPSATFAHTCHCCVTMVAMSCCAILYAHWFCFAAQNFNAIHCDVTMTLNIGITILPDLNWFWNYFINKGNFYWMISFCFISVYTCKTNIDCSVIGWWWKLSLPRCCSYRPFYHPPPPPSPGVIEGPVWTAPWEW